MSSNRVVRSMNLSQLTKGGQQVILAVATKTELWERPEEVAKTHAVGFQNSVEKDVRPLPEGTAKLIMREGDHQSEGDKRDHYTVVCVDAQGNYIATEHVPAEK